MTFAGVPPGWTFPHQTNEAGGKLIRNFIRNVFLWHSMRTKLVLSVYLHIFTICWCKYSACCTRMLLLSGLGWDETEHAAETQSNPSLSRRHCSRSRPIGRVVWPYLNFAYAIVLQCERAEQRTFTLKCRRDPNLPPKCLFNSAVGAEIYFISNYSSYHGGSFLSKKKSFRNWRI